MKKLFSIFIYLTLLVTPGASWSIAVDPIRCYKELQLNFFQEAIVYQGLSLYTIPQGLWAPISQTLRLKSSEIPQRMKRVTANMVPNPIEYPMQRGPTARILKQVLMDIFYETMSKYQVNERPTADFIFDYIFTQQLSKFIDCFGEEARELAPSFD